MGEIDASRDGTGAPPSGVAATHRPWVIHPFFFGAFPVLSLYRHNIFETRPKDLVWPLGAVLVSVPIIWLITWLVTRDRCRSGIWVSAFTGMFFTVNSTAAWLTETIYWITSIWVPTELFVKPIHVIAIDAVLLLVLWFVLRSRRDRTVWNLTKYLNAFSLILVAMSLGSIANSRRAEPEQPFKPGQELPVAVPGQPTKTPDIYYIILDGFARGDVQKEIFGYDLEPFLQRLEHRGFYIARKSTANYCQTPLCLSSSLNSVYLDELMPPEARQDISQIGTLIGDGTVVRAVHSQGYQFVSFSTGFEQTEIPKADSYYTPVQYLRLFHRLILSETPLIHLMPNPRDRKPYELARDRTLFLLDTLPKIAYDRAPTFAFAHFLSPHPPFLFGECGEDVSPIERPYLLSDGTVYKHYYKKDDYIPSYRAQTAYLVKRVEEMIDKILANSPEPPVIILQSDHGSGSRLDTESIEKSDLHERMSILNAYYLPGHTGPDVGLYQTITPVNSFRVVFNTYLGAKLPLLPDRNYFSTWPAPFRFIDVTTQVQAEQNRGAEVKQGDGS